MDDWVFISSEGVEEDFVEVKEDAGEAYDFVDVRGAGTNVKVKSTATPPSRPSPKKKRATARANQTTRAGRSPVKPPRGCKNNKQKREPKVSRAEAALVRSNQNALQRSLMPADASILYLTRAELARREKQTKRSGENVALYLSTKLPHGQSPDKLRRGHQKTRNSTFQRMGARQMYGATRK